VKLEGKDEDKRKEINRINSRESSCPKIPAIETAIDVPLVGV
jgi:hypothetical protein